VRGPTGDPLRTRRWATVGLGEDRRRELARLHPSSSHSVAMVMPAGGKDALPAAKTPAPRAIGAGFWLMLGISVGSVLLTAGLELGEMTRPQAELAATSSPQAALTAVATSGPPPVVRLPSPPVILAPPVVLTAVADPPALPPRAGRRHALPKAAKTVKPPKAAKAAGRSTVRSAAEAEVASDEMARQAMTMLARARAESSF
jgi:hypothetical protein